MALSYHSLYNFEMIMDVWRGCGSSQIWLPPLQVKDRIVVILVHLPALTVPGTWWVLSNYLFCCVIVNMLNDMENSLLPISQLIAYLTSITAFPLYPCWRNPDFVWSFTLHKATCLGNDSSFLVRGRACVVTGPVNLCSPTPLACGPIPANEVWE